MVDDATHGTSMRPLPASTAAASKLALPYIHADDTQARHVRTRQCVNVLDHDVYVDCDGDIDVLLGSSWQLVGSVPNQVPLNAGDGTFSTSIRI